jgi:hypothetical protein
VITWYSRAPISPAGTAQKAMAYTSSGLPPRAFQRYRPSSTAATTPSAIIRPYMCNGPSWLDPGLGMEARSITSERLARLGPARAEVESCWTRAGSQPASASGATA